MKPAFDLLRAVFWLIAFMVAVIMGIAVFGVAVCALGAWWGKFPPGHCQEAGIYQIIHDWWAEILAAIFALLAAGRGLPPSPPSPPTTTAKEC